MHPTPRPVGWDPARYLAFEGHRLRPAHDLIARIPLAAPETVVDLGCGTGNVTRLLAERWPDARIIVIAGSPEMDSPDSVSEVRSPTEI